MKIWILILLLFTSCIRQKPKPVWSEEITEIIRKDAENKKAEIMMLKEIEIAQQNEDQDAFMFYFQEYINIERLDINEEWKSHPEYIEGGIDVKY
jgi:hypothetical protein